MERVAQDRDPRLIAALLLVVFYFVLRLFPDLPAYYTLLGLGVALERLARIGGQSHHVSLGLAVRTPGRTVIAAIVTPLAMLLLLFVYGICLRKTGHLCIANGYLLFPGPAWPIENITLSFTQILVFASVSHAVFEELFFRGYVISRL